MGTRRKARKDLTPDERHELARTPLPIINHYGGKSWGGKTSELAANLRTQQTHETYYEDGGKE